ncbi:uncharacterized protein SAPINGB_P002408 [Magnusiomyces paraingens]|uniref:Reverse transcriptase domain-containing protein n=1 Tax=Magnusiomyces paraingens TaxID=2606893 RepID=A0A5E8BJJ3_9ASCO|nr:uncharacterized protein SAPINGB_P002408 [Saprochaete ingens]VVT49717.1 unnamed protein product [Saprochaete ingens]
MIPLYHKLEKKMELSLLLLTKKRHEIWKALLPEIDHGLDREFEIDDDSRWPKLEFDEVDSALADTPNDKAPGDDGITGKVLKMAWLNKDFKESQEHTDQFPYLRFHLKYWKNYTKRMTKLTTHLLPPEQYGGRQGYCATDAVLELVQRIETSKEKISAMLIDIQGAFDNVNRNILADTMEDMKLPKALINWTYQFVSEREASMLMDRRKGSVQKISTGIPQGSPISPLLFLIYSTPMYHAIKEWGGTPFGFIDDVTITVEDEKVQLTLPNGELREPQKEVKLLGITLNNLLDFKSHILNKINKARKAVGAIWHLGGVQKNMALRRIVGAYRTTPIAVLQKEAGIMPYSIRLKFMVARKAIRLHLNISKTNPINGHLLTLIEKSPIAKLTTLYMLAKDDRDYMIKKDEKRKCKRVEPLTLKQQQNQTIGILKKQAMEEWQEMYWNSSKDLWYHNITVESKCTDNLSKMVTGVIMKKDSRRILSNITQFHTGHGNFGAWFKKKKFGIEKDSYNCKCGELETVHHILVECPLLEEERKGLKRISPEMDITNIDLVYGSVDLLHRISFSGVDENTLSDHSIVEWDIYMSQSKNGDEVFTSVKRLNIKNADWEKFDKELSSAIKDFNVHNKTLKSTDQIDDQAKVLEEVVKRAMAKSMKEVKVMKKSKRYWNQELREKLEKALEAKREARQRQPSLALKRQKIEEAKKARKIFDHSLREASTEQWNKYLSSLEGNDIWKILKYINPKSNDTIIPQIRKEDGTLTTTVDEKRHEIWKALLPEIDHGLDREFEIDDDSRWPKLEFDEVDSALADTPNDKAPGDDGITGKVLKMAWLNKDFKERFSSFSKLV